MKLNRLFAALTLVNLALTAYLLVRTANPVQAASVAPVLRGKMLEIVDDQGRVRASIKLHPASVFQQTGRAIPETVMFRLIDEKGRPEVKIGASADGGGLGFVGAKDSTQVLLGAEGAESRLKLVVDGREQLWKP